MMKTTEKDWKPVRKGKLYCSPACGRGCTYAEYLSVQIKAHNLIKKCQAEVGGRWVTHIHENLGWHYCVSLGENGITIHEYDYNNGLKPYYTVSSNPGGTPMQVHVDLEQDCSIEKLVLAQLTAMKKEADRWTKEINKNKKALSQ